MSQMRERRSSILDALFALALASFAVGVTVRISDRMEPDRPIDAIGVALIAITGLVLAVRQRWPLPVLATATVCTSAYLALGYTYGPILIAFFVAVYSAARHLPMRVSLPACSAALALLLVHLLTNSSALNGFLGLGPASAWVVVPYAVGITVRQARLAAEQARAELIREHVADERLRVAQEVHDVVGHGLAAIKMQADVALHVLDKKPEQAGTALHAISRTSTEALEELRAALALVRRPEDDRSPGPGLDQLGDLCRRMADAGIDVRIAVAGDPVRLRPAADLVAYRVAQEALTNVARHSAGSVADVHVVWQPDAMTLTVTSKGSGVVQTPGGLGIPGMRTRVEGLGGSFAAGPTKQGDFKVHATLPIVADEQPPADSDEDVT